MRKETKKLTLDLDLLTVETFETASGSHTRGTVHGHATIWPECQPTQTCVTDNQCMNTFGCHTAYCVQSAELPCPTATCHDGCTADCTYNGPTVYQTCPATCDWGCQSNGASACAN